MKPRSIGLSFLGALGIAALVASSAAAGTSTESLDNGAEVSATIDTPEAGDTFLIPPPDTDIDVPIEGSASIGEGDPTVHWTTVIDVSGSTNVANTCATQNILACEKEAALNLNGDVVASQSAVDVGLAIYATRGASADVDSAGGVQSVVAPDSADYTAAVNSITYDGFSGGGQIALHTGYVVGGGTNFVDGLRKALVSVNASAGTVKNVVFMSDGFSNGETVGAFNNAVAALDAAGATIYSFAVGSGASCTGGNIGTLQAMADATGGSCTQVTDPTTLPDIVANVVATTMTDVSVTVDSVSVPSTKSNPPPFPGPGSTNVTATAANQEPGAHEACLTATGADSTSTQDVTVCETYQVYAFELNPATATNELSDDDTHTVTATLVGEAGELEGFSVQFDVTSGPNTGATDIGATDSSGNVDFTYTNPSIDPTGLGTDTIQATVTVNGQSATLTVDKEWVDTITPVSTCLESVNPSGKKEPSAPGKGGQGQNQDGFYIVEATDNIWPADGLQMFVTDDGSGTVFGPFAVGTVIKWTEDDGATPEQKTIGGPNSAVDWHIIGNGDAEVTAVDGSGNVSDGTSCLVPPSPK